MSSNIIKGPLGHGIRRCLKFPQTCPCNELLGCIQHEVGDWAAKIYHSHKMRRAKKKLHRLKHHNSQQVTIQYRKGELHGTKNNKSQTTSNANSDTLQPLPERLQTTSYERSPISPPRLDVATRPVPERPISPLEVPLPSPQAAPPSNPTTLSPIQNSPENPLQSPPLPPSLLMTLAFEHETAVKKATEKAAASKVHKQRLQALGVELCSKKKPLGIRKKPPKQSNIMADLQKLFPCDHIRVSLPAPDPFPVDAEGNFIILEDSMDPLPPPTPGRRRYANDPQENNLRTPPPEPELEGEPDESFWAGFPFGDARHY